MAVSTISSEINDSAGGSIANVRVVARLLPRPAFETATGIVLAATLEATSDAAGQYSFVLTETTSITPSGSYYEIIEYVPDRYGGPVKHTIQVGAANTTVYASLVSAPPAPAVSTYLTQTSGDARYVQSPGTFGAAGDLSVIKPDDAASGGALSTYPRSDHQHAIAAAVAGTILPDAAAAEGSATSFARSDHTHAIAAATAGESRPADTAAEGSATSFARSDHKHDREQVYGTAAARAALTGTDLYNGLLATESDTHKLMRYTGSAWQTILPRISCTDITRPTGIAAGQEIFETNTLRTKHYDGTSWWTIAIAGNGVSTSTPTLSQGAGVAVTVQFSNYRIINGVCEWWFRLTSAGTGTAATAVVVPLPVTSAEANLTNFGSGIIYDSSTGTIYPTVLEQLSTTTVGFHSSVGNNTMWGVTPNITLGSGDEFRCTARFRVATAA